MKQFEVKTKITFGAESLDRLLVLGCRRAMIICDPFIEQVGLIDHVTVRLKATGVTYAVWSKVVPDPPLNAVIEGIGEVLKFRPEYLIAMGGGSAIDTAKAIRKLGKEADPTFCCKLIAIPTTSGTGSEVTNYAVITDTEKGIKIPLTSEDMLPEEAILDAVLTESVPKSVTADTGMDVMTHAIEAYVSKRNNEFTGAMAEKAVELCSEYLLRSYAFEETHDERARQKMHVASCLAGMAFNVSSLGLCHGMAHQLGAEYHIPHGRANAMLLPHVIEYNSNQGVCAKTKEDLSGCIHKYCNLARIMGIGTLKEEVSVRAMTACLRFTCSEMHIPMRMRDAVPGLTRENYQAKIPLLAKNALADACTATNPRTPTLEDVVKLYEELY